MKQVILVVLFAAMAGVGSAYAQSVNEKSKRISNDEVPAAVRQAFEKEHSDIESKGYWRVYFTEKTESGKTTFTPERYIFTGKKDGEKISLSYSADGTKEESKAPDSGGR